MKIRHLSIKYFRGIKELSWNVIGSTICLVGPGDSTKSTILDAIELALSSRWNLTFNDSDFFECNTQNPIEIIVTVGEIPDRLHDDQKFGLHLRGWNKDSGLIDEPADGFEEVISIKLIIDSSLEPSWFIVTDRNNDGVRISSKDREALGVARLGGYVDRHLSWSRGSALSKLTDDFENIPSILADASRKAKESVSQSQLDVLKNASSRAQQSAIQFGVKPHKDFIPALDIGSIAIGASFLSLHDGDIPVRLAGQGSKRLLAIALEKYGLKSGAILLIDEIEQALEGFRVRNLLRLVKINETEKGQVILTTHSNVVVTEMALLDMFVVRNIEGITTVTEIPSMLKSSASKTPDALLARKVIVCEGLTELGFCQALNHYWSNTMGIPMEYHGVVPVVPFQGGGNDAPKVAFAISELGYITSFFGDSDKEINPKEADLNKKGVKVIRWADKKCIEQRICMDLPWETVEQFIELCISVVSEYIENEIATQSVLDAICARLNLASGSLKSIDPNTWINPSIDQHAIRKAIGDSAAQKGWFKKIDIGFKLGEFVISKLEQISPETDLFKKIKLLQEWIYD